MMTIRSQSIIQGIARVVQHCFLFYCKRILKFSLILV